MAVLIQSLNVRSDIECWRAMERPSRVVKTDGRSR